MPDAGAERPGSATTTARLGIVRMLLAGLVGLRLLTAAGAGVPRPMTYVVSGGEPPPSVGSCLAFATVVLAALVGASVADRKRDRARASRS